MLSKATTAMYIDKSHPKGGSNKYLVYIRVTYDRNNKYFATPYSLTVTEFEKIKSEKPGKLLKELSLQIQAFEKKAADVIKELPFFSFGEFEKRFRANRSSKNIISQAFEDYVQTLRNNN